MKFLRNNLANLLTLSNLFSGCLAVVFLMNGRIDLTALCLVISLICDFFDGFVARLLKSNSPLGIQLDSLADMVTFGFIPGLAMYQLLNDHYLEAGSLGFPYPYVGFLITLASCLRLAIFNIDQEQKYYFKGLNTPTNTLLVFGLLYALRFQESFLDTIDQPIFLLLVTLMSSYLLISPIRMFSLKLASKDFKALLPLVLILVIAVVLLLALKYVAVPFIVLTYILISLLFQKRFYS